MRPQPFAIVALLLTIPAHATPITPTPTPVGPARCVALADANNSDTTNFAVTGSIPSKPDGRVANDAAGNVIETQPHKGRVARFDDCKEIASTRGVRCELSTRGAFLACSSWAGTDESIIAATKLRRKKS